MYRVIHDFLNDWGYEAEATLGLIEHTTTPSLSQRVGPLDRSLGEVAWHIVVSLSAMMAEAGTPIDGPTPDIATPTETGEIASGYERGANGLMREVGSWSDEKLAGEVRMYGQNWTWGSLLRAIIDHQAHHRGQMTVLMRQAGIEEIPGMYGPARAASGLVGSAGLSEQKAV